MQLTKEKVLLNTPVVRQEAASHSGAATQVFLVLSAFLMVAIVYAAFNMSSIVSYERDIWHHLSVYRELIAAPFHAMNPHVATDDPSRSYSPWTVGVALVARAGGLDAFGATAISAILSSLSVLIGIFLFSREYFKNAWAPTLLLIAFFGTWWNIVNHTGYHTVAAFLFSVSYPFAIVLGGGFILWWLVLRALRSERGPVGYGMILTALGAPLFITHQLQGLFSIGAGLSLALFAGQASLSRRLFLSFCLLAGLFASQFWWYFDPVEYVFKSEVRDGHSAPRILVYSLDNISMLFATLGLALLGLLGMVNARTDRLRLELFLPLLVIVAGFAFLLIKGNWVTVRIVPFMALFLQIGLVGYLLTPGRDGRFGKTGIGLRAVIVCALLVGLVHNISSGYKSYNTAQMYLELGDTAKHYSTWSHEILLASAYAETLVPEGATVIAHLQTAFPMEATSLNVVAIPRLFAEVPNMLERQANNRAFFDPATDTATRCAIIAQYDVQMIVYRDYWLDDKVEAQLDSFGTRRPKGDMSFIPAESGQFAACTR